MTTTPTPERAPRKIVMLRLDLDLVEGLQKQALLERTSQSSIIRKAVAEYLRRSSTDAITITGTHGRIGSIPMNDPKPPRVTRPRTKVRRRQRQSQRKQR